MLLLYSGGTSRVPQGNSLSSLGKKKRSCAQVVTESFAESGLSTTIERRKVISQLVHAGGV
jgi:hypothetical protein